MSSRKGRPAGTPPRDPPPTPSAWVPLLQALVAREMVEQEGLSLKRAGECLGIGPSAVSQYLSGKRQARLFGRYAASSEAQQVARDVAQSMLTGPTGLGSPARLLLAGAARLAALEEPAPGSGGLPPPERPAPTRELSRSLRQRVRAEQAAVTECMVLAQRARDELTRAIFRQIASDSLRHAEIVASLATYLDRGVTNALASGISRRDVEGLIEAERRAETGSGRLVAESVGGTLALLVESMEDDERKHTELLEGLLRSGFGPVAPRRRGATGAAGGSR